MKDRFTISQDITIILTDSGILKFYSKMDDCSIAIDDEEARAIYAYLQRYLGEGDER
jgi:hypothetical protein